MTALMRGLSIAWVLFLSALALAGDLTAEQIAERIVRDGAFQWEGAETRLRMVLFEAGGAQKERKIDVLGRRNGKSTETVVRFRAPADVAGTAFLMRQTGDESEQHIYLPGLKRTRRIVGREREGSFMGSDFTYADMQRADVKNATHRKLPDETLNGSPVYVLESTPKKGARAPYTKVVTWVRKTDFVPLRTRFYGKDGRLAKTLYALKIKVMDGRPVVIESRMQSENGHATLLVVESLERRDNLPDSAFTPTALER